MDKIQKELIKAGRKDLADEYYEKIAKEQPTLEIKRLIEKSSNGSYELSRAIDEVSRIVQSNPSYKKVKKSLLDIVALELRSGLDSYIHDVFQTRGKVKPDRLEKWLKEAIGNRSGFTDKWAKELEKVVNDTVEKHKSS